jgi:hypothetical protein
MAEEPLITETPVSYRRYLLLKRLAFRETESFALQGVYRQKQEAQPGTALPAGFPFFASLTAAGYTTQEDLVGATRDELSRYVGISSRDADAVLTAFADLPPLP